MPNDFELIVQMDALDQVSEALPCWAVAEVIVHSPARPYRSGERSEPGVVVSAPPDERLLEHLPNDVRMYAAAAEAVAVRVLGQDVVAVCAASDVTETLWDVGIDTIEGRRRRGYATACFHTLADWMAARGRQPVCAAYENYPPSLKLAEKLGFQPVDRIAVLPHFPSKRSRKPNLLRAFFARSGRRSSAGQNTVVSSRSRSASIVAPWVDGATEHRRLRPLLLCGSPVV